ncbi:DUF2798 domain-containing protein [Sphingobacterium olei]|uniref:DUF2798 domain-containing protein n=1 Tax=Sphingobacterium olei TaxID=2571155 RepID=A0A4U0NU87_9SPHI|nr:DUF2798 domain-containing protein [Sphingobacterium olei]
MVKKSDGLKDKTILITDGTSGIGLEAARQFLVAGAKVIAYLVVIPCILLIAPIIEKVVNRLIKN